MTPEEQRETALRLYRLAWRFPEKAPKPKWSTRLEKTVVECVNPIKNPLSIELTQAVTVTVSAFNRDVVRVEASCAPERKFWFFGSSEYVETMLRSVPAELRPHVECKQ